MCRGREREFGPRWRSGRSPSTPVRYRRSTPLSPTTQTNLHISSHRYPPSPPRSPPKVVRSSVFRGARRVPAGATAPAQDAVRIAALQASLRSRARFRPGRVPAVGTGGTFVRRPAPRRRPSPTMRGDEDHAPARHDPACSRCAAPSPPAAAPPAAAGARDDPAALIPAGAPVYVEGVAAPRRQGPQRPRGRAEEDPAHRRPRREDHQAAQGQRQGREGHLQGRRRAMARRSLRRRGHRAAQRPRTPTTWPSIASKDDGKADKTAGQADGRHRQALLQGRRLPLRPQGQDRDGDRRSPRRGRHRGRPEGGRRCQGRRHAGRVQRPGRRALQGRPGPRRAPLPRRPGPAAHGGADREQRSAGRRHAAVLLQRGAQDDRRGAPGAARRPADRRGQHRDAEVGDDRAAAAPTSWPRCPATRGWAWAWRTSARPSTASCRRWPAAAGSPASASTPCSASSRSRRAWTCARTCSAGWATPACSSAVRRAPTSAGRS